MATKIFNARQFASNKNIIRRKDLDFTDDGTRFNFYSYKDTVGFHVTRWQDNVFICIRIDYTHEVDNELPYIPHKEYQSWEAYKVCDEFNYVKNDEVDLERFYTNLESVFQAIKNYITK